MGIERKPVIISGGKLGLGGVQTHLALLCGMLRREEVETVVFATGSYWDSTALDGLKHLGVKFVMPPRPFRSSPRLASIYCTLRWPGAIPKNPASLCCIGAGSSHRLLARLTRRKCLGIYHEIVSPPGKASAAGACIDALGAAVANSEAVARDMRLAWPEKPIRVIPFLTSSAPAPEPLPRRRAGDRELRVVYLGRLVTQKRPDQLVRNWDTMCSRAPLKPARLDLYGSDAESGMLETLRKVVCEGGLSDRIGIHGAYDHSDLSKILADADLVVLPSLWEGLPLVLVEAMQRGIPIAATRAGGSAELGRDNPDVVITGTDWDSFADGLHTLAARLRAGDIDAIRLHGWTEQRYGYQPVSERWLSCLLQPRAFFGLA